MTSATTFSTSIEAQQAAALLDSYRFELGGHDARQWVSLWLEFYRPSWIRDAVVEALYQGRYKSVSVRQILEMWQRRAKPIRHVTHEFEAAVCRELGEVKTAPVAMAALPHVQRRNQSLRNRSLRNQSAASQFSSPSWSPSPSPPSSSPPSSSPPSSSAVSQSPEQSSLVSPSSVRQVLGVQSSLHQSPPNSEVTQKFTYSSAPTISFNLSKRSPAPESKVSLTNQPSSRFQSEAMPLTVTSSEPPPHRPAAQMASVTKTGGVTKTGVTDKRLTNRSTTQKPKATSGIDSGRRLDNTAWREFPTYTTPTHALPDLDETLRLQRQFKEDLNESDRAIQPFKPALPFSAQTLRLAKQQASPG